MYMYIYLWLIAMSFSGDILNNKCNNVYSIESSDKVIGKAVDKWALVVNKQFAREEIDWLDNIWENFDFSGDQVNAN